MAIGVEGLPPGPSGIIPGKDGVDKSMDALSSGRKIGSAADGPAVVAISAELDAAIQSLNQANRNVSDGLSVVRTAESGLQSSAESLIRLKELAVKAGSSTLSDSDRAAIQTEVGKLTEQLDAIAETTEFNGTNLLNDDENSLTFQVGAGSEEADRINFDTVDVTSEGLGLADPSVGTVEDAQAMMDAVDSAMNQVITAQTDAGSTATRLGIAADLNTNAVIARSSALSNMRDTDFAAESTELSSSLVQRQASVAMRAQANAVPSVMLKLLG